MLAEGAVAARDFLVAMGQHVSSVCVITTLHDGAPYGLTVTAVSSVCAEPPRLLVCVNKSGASHDHVSASGVFCVNVLAEGQENVARVFAGQMGRNANRFATGEWQALKTGAPALARAAAVFDCRLVETVSASTHSIFIGEVVATRCAPGVDALLYGARRFRTLRKQTESVGEGELGPLHF